MNNNLEQAKNIFIEYSGNHYFMERDGVLEKYRKFNVSKEKEITWIKEYQNDLILKMQKEDYIDELFTEFSQIVCDFQDYESLKTMIDIASLITLKKDTFLKLRIVEEIIKVVKKAKKDKSKKIIFLNEAIKKSCDILNSIKNEKIFISDHYTNNGFLKDILTESKIIERINELYNYCRTQGIR